MPQAVSKPTMRAMPTPEEYQALKQALAQVNRRSESLAGELRVVRTERDLLQETLKKFLRQLFAVLISTQK